MAAQFLFERAHASNPRSVDNKVQIGRAGAILPICRLMDSELEATRFQACSALSELAFCNEANCRAIIATPGCLESIVTLLDPEHGSTQCDAALILNNCAAFCSDTCGSIVHYPGMLPALQALAVSDHTSSKNVAVGAINSLSRCPSSGVRLAMVGAGVADDTLRVVLGEEGEGDMYEARMARAAMAMANLIGHEEDTSLSALPNFAGAIVSICKIMRHALAERSWAGIFFAPYSVCLPLYNLSLSAEHRAVLVQNGMVELVADLLQGWKQGHQADNTLELALALARQLLLSPDGDEQRERAEACGLVDAVRATAEGARGESRSAVREAKGIVSDLRQRHEAVWMGQAARLGGAGGLYLLDDAVMELVVKLAGV